MHFTVAFDEADGEGIVFFGNYFRLAHRALEAYLPTIGIPWTEWFNNAEWAAPLRHVEADYLQPLRPGDTFAAEIKVSDIGESSVSFMYEFKTPSGQPIARLKTTHVFIDRATIKKRPIPGALRLQLTPSP
jgi:YbgC/YbaW family acyl-CoA thioester hydrolase